MNCVEKAFVLFYINTLIVYILLKIEIYTDSMFLFSIAISLFILSNVFVLFMQIRQCFFEN